MHGRLIAEARPMVSKPILMLLKLIILFICVISTSIHFLFLLLDSASSFLRCSVCQTLLMLRLVFLLFPYDLCAKCLSNYHWWRCNHCLEMRDSKHINICGCCCFIIWVAVVLIWWLKIVTWLASINILCILFWWSNIAVLLLSLIIIWLYQQRMLWRWH